MPIPRAKSSSLLVDYSQNRAYIEVENQFKKKSKPQKSSSSRSSRGRSPIKNKKPRRVRSGGNFTLRYLGVNSKPQEPTLNGPANDETTLLELQILPQEGAEEETDTENIKFAVRLSTLGIDCVDDLQVSHSDSMNFSSSRRRMTRSSSHDDMMDTGRSSRRSSSLSPTKRNLRRSKSEGQSSSTTTTTTTTTSATRVGSGRRSMSPVPKKAPSNSSLAVSTGSSHGSNHEQKKSPRREQRPSLKLSGLEQSNEGVTRMEDASNRSLTLLDASTNSLTTGMSNSFSKRRARFMNRSLSFGMDDSATDSIINGTTPTSGWTIRGGRRTTPKRSKSTDGSFNNNNNNSFRLNGDDSLRNSMNQSWASLKQSHDMNGSFSSFISGSRIRIHSQVSPEAA